MLFRSCSGALWAEWQTLRYLEEPESADPLVNPSEAERLLAVTKALLTGSATQEQQNEASQALLDAIKYYNSLDEAKGKEFQNLVNKKLKEHAAEFKVSK